MTAIIFLNNSINVFGPHIWPQLIQEEKLAVSTPP